MNVNAGTTTLNLNQVYNFSSITVAGGATLAFTGVGAALLNCSGNVSIAGTIELRGLVATRGQGSLFTSKGELGIGGTPYATATPNVGGTSNGWWFCGFCLGWQFSDPMCGVVCGVVWCGMWCGM